MTLRRALIWYVVLLHLVVAVAGGVLLWPVHRPWILVLEAGLAVTLLLGFLLVRAMRLPQEVVQLGTEWMKEGDFAHTFRAVGTADLKRLIELYNAMVAQLREERRRQHEQDLFLHKVLAASPSGVLTTTHDGRFDLVNPAAERLLGLSADELRGRLPSEHQTPLVRQLAEVERDESRLLGMHGRRRLRCTHSTFFDRGFSRSFFVVDDLTHELWSSEKAAYHAVIRILSHEVNNTLGATSSILHSALAYGDQLRPADRDDFTAALEVAIERAEHLSHFMQRYAEVVRVPEPRRQPTDVVALLQRIENLMASDCRAHGVRLELEVEHRPEPEAVNADPIQMEQVLVNLVRNSLEAIGEGGEIRLVVGRRGDAVALAVEDSGPGLSVDAERNLFSPFFSTKPQGQGVGLTLIREILSLHQVDFFFERPPGGPTRFVIVFEG